MCIRVWFVQCSASVMVTDLPEFVELMECNIEQNRDCITGTVTAKALKWYSL